MMEPEWIIELDHVAVAHAEGGEQRLVEDVCWRIVRGDCWVVGGPTGVGKTSLLETAAGLNRAADGTVRMFGRVLAEATEKEQIEWKQWIGFVFENGGRLLRHLSVAENVALPLRYHRAMKEDEVDAIVTQWLERARLNDHAHAMPSRLSPRFQQRIALARALVTPKAAVFVDNPPEGRSRDTIWWRDQLAALASQNCAVIVSTNDFSAWLDAATRFAIVENGKFTVLGNSNDVRAAADASWRDYIMVN
jgi:ABC-type transporter Mla maintaining outer membrane lipid asymmetry ATPase subunit MlaF